MAGEILRRIQAREDIDPRGAPLVDRPKAATPVDPVVAIRVERVVLRLVREDDVADVELESSNSTLSPLSKATGVFVSSPATRQFLAVRFQ